jgi:hypothetical protein
MPSRPSLSADLNAVIARVTPDVLALLGDGVPRARGTILAVLADRHPRDDVRRTLLRLVVTGQLVEQAASTPCQNRRPGRTRAEGAISAQAAARPSTKRKDGIAAAHVGEDAPMVLADASRGQWLR